jgi:hypothetical protein
MSLMPPSARSSLSRSRCSVSRSFLVYALRLVRGEHLVERAQPLDRVRHRLPIGQRAAEPARIDVVLRRLLRGFGNGVLSLPLGADEQDAAAIGDRVADRLQGAVQHRHGLRQIDDVDVVAGAEDVLSHLRVPTVGLMAKVNASFQKLAHAVVGQRHSHSPVDSAADR